MIDWALAIPMMVSFIGGAVTSWIGFRVQFERFKAMDQEREKHWSEWRQTLELRLNNHASRIEIGASHEARLQRIERVLNGLLSSRDPK